MTGKAINHDKNFKIWANIVCLVLLVCAGCKKTGQDSKNRPAFEIGKLYQKGPLAVHIRVDKSKITIAQTLLLELETAIGSGYDVNMPKIETDLKDFGVIDRQNLGNRLDANNNPVSTYRYRLEPFLSGRFSIPAITFEFHDVNTPAGKTYQLTTEPIDIEVTSLLGEQRGKLVIADIEDVVDMPARMIVWWLLPIVAIVISAGGLWLYFRKEKAKLAVRVLKSAHEIAFARLDDLIQKDLIKAGKIKEFYEAINNILRHYIEDRFELRAPERTTEEFLAEIRNTSVLSGNDRGALAEFLTHCDLVKFAKFNPTPEQIQRTIDLAKSFIEQTKSEEKQIDVTDRVETSQPAGAGGA